MAVIFKEEDFMTNWATDCRFTLIGKFSNAMPKMELIRKSFIIQTQLSGGVKIAHYNSRHVYIDLDNELDYITETPLCSMGILPPGLPWHCYKKEIIIASCLLSGKVLYLDNASTQNKRPAVVRIQIDLTKEKQQHIWFGYDEEDLTRGKWQAIEYDNIPHHQNYRKHQGHIIQACTIKQRDEDYQKRKEMEANKKNKPKGEQEKQDNTSPTRREGKQTDIQANENAQVQQEKEDHEQDDQWQIQKRKQHNNQDQGNTKTEWRPRSPQNKENRDQGSQQAARTGMTHIISTHNIYKDLDMQEQPTTGKDGEDTNEQPEEQEDQAKYESRKDSPSTNHHSTKHIQKDQDAVSQNRRPTGIDLSLPTPLDPSILHMEHAVHVDEVSGGMAGGIQEKPTNLQDGVTKGRELTHVLHEGEYTDHLRDYRAPATPQNRKNQIQNQHAEVPHIQSTGKENQSAEISPQRQSQAGTTGKHITGIPQEKEGIIVQTPQHSKVPGEPPDKPPNNKSQARLSKKRRDAIKKRQLKESDPDKEQQRQNDVEEEFDEYGVNNSEDEYDQDTQSIDIDEDEEEEISNQLIKAFGSTFHTEYQEEVQEVTGKQGLSPRGRKETRQTTKSNSTSATMSRPNTRAKSRGL
ncbi:hypothetical protein H5410_064452 [Solanum commersonii]|uniref:DUF4283 domain-containing protein n=1 Tax=Solanum commersonii TaxID=4109 RepID=A0A9J5VZE1_SOLCO|nr:hypothetical protein H5410_064452 [Solanum commersonii]